MQEKRNQYKKIISAFLKLIVFVATLYYLYFKVIDSEQFGEFFPQFLNLSSASITLLVLVFVFMMLNWSLETIKWKLLIGKLEHISFIKSLMAVWSGLTINNWIPNRTAEFLGRILFIRKENRIKAISSTLAGNVAQLITMLSIGSVSFILWNDGFSMSLKGILLLFSGVMTIFLSVAYFNIGIINKWFKNSKILNRFQKYVDVLSDYTSKELGKVLALSILRLGIYVAQYYLLLLVFGVDLNFPNAFVGICTIFFIQSILPAITITEIGVRGATVIFVLEHYTNSYSSLLAAAYSLWIINVIIPNFFGAIFIVIKKQEKNTN